MQSNTLLSDGLTGLIAYFSATAVPAFTIPGTADTLSFNAANPNFTVPGTVVQTGNGSSTATSSTGAVNLSYNDNITLDDLTKQISISGSDVVTNSTDTISIFATGPIAFDNLIYSLQPTQIVVSAASPTSALNLTTNITSASTPEPSSLALLGTGILGVIGAARRRFAA